MNLDKFYSLRKDFVVIGLTGRAGAGCSEIAKKISNANFVTNISYNPKKPILEAEKIKFDICYNYLSVEDNFKPFEVIKYKNVLLLHLIYESKSNIYPIEYIISTITQYGDGYDCGDGGAPYTNRFGISNDSECIDELRVFLNKRLNFYLEIFEDHEKYNKVSEWLKNVEEKSFSDYFFNDFSEFCSKFYNVLNKYNITKRTRFIHDIAINLREVGCCNCERRNVIIRRNLDHIYTVAETINRIIKKFRKSNDGSARVIIDSLKNSLELMYFKEKYSGFYMIAVNKSETEREEYIKRVLKERHDVKNIENHIKEIINLSNGEYDGKDVNDGDFGAPDVENCIQKSGYHIYHSQESSLNGEDNRQINLEYQLVKFLSLIGQPGIITPTPIERTMQVAFNAKYNSGCISRQVGAVVTDLDYSIKSIGWNDVAQHQMSCKLRSVKDLVNGKSKPLFSEYELNGGQFEVGKEKFTFKALVSEDVEKVDFEKLKGRPCPFCFKTFQNTYEKEKNQVHTRSLHAEENAMMQITKNGGIGLKGGYLFTTASPCELCSKKAYQLGVTKIYYIDPYPGIATTHILKSGIKEENNPELEMFRGAVGRTFHKLYEPFMAHKDEIKILTGLRPIKREKNQKKPSNIELIDQMELSEKQKEKFKKQLKN